MVVKRNYISSPLTDMLSEVENFRFCLFRFIRISVIIQLLARNTHILKTNITAPEIFGGLNSYKLISLRSFRGLFLGIGAAHLLRLLLFWLLKFFRLLPAPPLCYLLGMVKEVFC